MLAYIRTRGLSESKIIGLLLHLPNATTRKSRKVRLIPMRTSLMTTLDRGSHTKVSLVGISFKYQLRTHHLHLGIWQGGRNYCLAIPDPLPRTIPGRNISHPLQLCSSTSTLTCISEGSTTYLRAADGMIQAPVILPSPCRFAVPGLLQRQRPFAGYKRFLCFTNTCNWIYTQHVDPQQHTKCGTIVDLFSAFSVQPRSTHVLLAGISGNLYH